MCIHVQMCISNSFSPSSSSIKSDCSRSSVAIVPSDPGPLEDQILASLANESDEQLSPKSLKTSVNERRSGGADGVMLFQDRLRIGDRRQRRHQVLHPVNWLLLRSMSGLLIVIIKYFGSRVRVYIV